MLRKSLSVLLIFVLIMGISSISSATELKTTLNVIQQASETKYLENDQGYISKTVVDSNKDTGEVTIELKLSNTAKEVETSTETEIFLVIDNSPSMDFVTQNGLTRKEIVISAAKKLVEKLLENSTSIKIGIVKFYGGYSESSASALMCSLTNDKNKVLETLETLKLQSTSAGTNILAGITRAKNNFSSNCQNKIEILLTDGVPNYDFAYNQAGNDTTTATAQKVQENTKNGIISIDNSGIYLISMMTGMSENDGNTDKKGNVYTNTSSVEDDLKAVEKIFGTSEKPTVGKFYLVASADVDNIINNDILKDTMEKIQNPINTTKIVDYFPEDITENFEFSYVGNPSVGTKTETIDTESKTITWDIGTLKGDEVATLKYKLKIKDMKNTELLNKTIATNQKVVLTYKDKDSKDYTVELTSSPKIQLSELKEELIATVSYNPTTETTKTVKATIKTNKKVNEVDGWTLSEDSMTLIKEYTKNTTETVHLVDIEGMTADVEVLINNIKTENSNINSNAKKDNTIAPGTMPYTGGTFFVILTVLSITAVAIYVYKRNNDLKGI